MVGAGFKSVFIVALVIVLLFLHLSPVISSRDLSPTINLAPPGWTEDIRITDNASAADRRPTIDFEEKNIHLAWLNSRSGENEVFYINSTDGGDTWSQVTQLSPGDPNDCSDPRINVDGNKVNMIWAENDGTGREIMYRNSTDSGNSWNNPIMVSIDDDEYSEGAKMVVNGSNIHVAWIDWRFGLPQTEIFYKRSTDGGVTWDDGLGTNQDRRLTFDLHGPSGPDIAINGSNIHVIYYDNKDSGNWDLFYLRSIDNGVNWDDGLGNVGSERILTTNSSDHVAGDIVADENGIHMVWVDTVWPGPIDYLYYINSTDNGASWSSPQLLSGPSPLISEPEIEINDGDVHICWGDKIDNGINLQNYYIRSHDNGASWDSEILLSSNLTDDRLWPRMALDDSTIHMTWWDERDENPEIYYKRYNAPDSELPEINHTPVVAANVNEVINITVNVTDNVEVNSVYLNYTDVSGGGDNVSMNKWNDNWYYDIPAQSNLGIVEYFIWANDTNDNTNMTEAYQIQINDNILPEINHAPVISVNVSVPIYITVNVTDDIQVDLVKINYTGVNGTWHNDSMAKSGNDWAFSIPGQNMSGNVTYFIWANDTSDNQNRTQEYLIQINDLPIVPPTDIEPPEIIHSPIASVYVDETINITANVTDNVTVSSVRLNYTGVDGVIHNVTMVGWNGNYSYIIPAQGGAGNVSYFIWANDSNGNFNQTQICQIQINEWPVPPDTAAPEIQHVPVSSVNITEPINITAIVTDDIGVANVFLNYTTTGGITHIVAMNQWGDVWGYVIPGQLEGNLTYCIRAVDTSGNENITAVFTINVIEPVIPDVTPPTVVSVSPSGANVSLSEPIVIQFSEYMNDTSVINAMIYSPEIDLGLIYVRKGETVTINHYDFEPGTTYQVTITTTATDLAGNHLVEDYSWEFTTEEAVIIEPPERESNAWIGVLIFVIAVCYLVGLTKLFKGTRHSKKSELENNDVEEEVTVEESIDINGGMDNDKQA